MNVLPNRKSDLHNEKGKNMKKVWTFVKIRGRTKMSGEIMHFFKDHFGSISIYFTHQHFTRAFFVQKCFAIWLIVGLSLYEGPLKVRLG
jgi:hypothetical protein